MEIGKADQKIYVAIGRDSYDGFSTLQWALRKWSGQGISIVILHGGHGFSKDYVYTPLGKLHVSSVSEEKLKALEKAEEAKTDKILSQYIAYCGKVKAEVIKLDKNDQQPLDKQIVQIISSLRITKLVVSFAFMKSSSLKSRTAISRSFYVLRHKPEFCEVFVICGGKLVFLNDEGFVEDDRGVMLARFKERSNSIKNWLGKMFLENAASTSPDLPSSSETNGPVNQWMKFSQEIEQYASELISSHEEEAQIVELENGASMELHMPKNMDAAGRIQLQCRIRKAEEAIKSNRNQANAAKERGEKAQWAISICNTRAEELEACINSEAVKSADLSKELDSRKAEINELGREVEEKRKKLNSILELQKELSGKLHLSSSNKARAEVQVEKAVRIRSGMVHEIEELRKQRDILLRRIEFCKEKDAIEKASKLNNGFGFDVREFSAAEIVAATEDFSERLRLKSTGRWTRVYKGRLTGTTVAIKVYDQAYARSSGDFAAKVKLVNQLRHPNIVAVIGFCSELNCIVYEYMHNRSLHDVLSSGEKNQSLNWHARIRIAAEMCSGLAFLHKAKPKPVIHGNLEPSKILLDRYQVAKVSGLESPCLNNDFNTTVDIQAYGNVLVHLLTGKNWEVGMGSDTGNGDFLDHLDGEWPMDLAMELYGIAMRCLLMAGAVEEKITTMPTAEINDVKKRADELIAKGGYDRVDMRVEVEETSNMPSMFLCPIYQDVMRNPHLAADGFSYEFEAIDEWLKSGHETSPMTNLRLKHKLLTPNHVLRSLIQDWRNKRSAA